MMVVSSNPEVQAHYVRLLRSSGNHEYAERIATGTNIPMPGIQTDATFLAGQGTLLDQFGDDPVGRGDLEYRIKRARKNGLTPNMHDVYDPTLASAPGAPDGFIPHDNARAQAKRVMRKRMYSKPKKSVAMAESAVQRMMRQSIQKNPDLARRPPAELRAEIIERHAYKPQKED